MAGIIGNRVIEFLDRYAKIRSFCCRVRMKLCIGESAEENPSESIKWINWRGLISYKNSKYKPIDCFRELENKEQNGILHMAAPCLTDYRRQYAILNEYTLLVKLHRRNNPNEQSCELLEGILAFLIYSVLISPHEGTPEDQAGKAIEEVGTILRKIVDKLDPSSDDVNDDIIEKDPYDVFAEKRGENYICAYGLKMQVN